ncbi:hypothetical protein [Anabaena lutea]|uniref:Uncharacterized protein n=1 Tax=Anabaena lutea FACHB-196 TaxID=2692881 RepID=A0ABR8F9U4_9NOST|nr:hypothetical protein [Anabaena lutea]MBD2566975.1 hypothetical protein [Anabaena lutea FACHB-196]
MPENIATSLVNKNNSQLIIKKSKGQIAVSFKYAKSNQISISEHYHYYPDSDSKNQNHQQTTIKQHPVNP